MDAKKTLFTLSTTALALFGIGSTVQAGDCFDCMSDCGIDLGCDSPWYLVGGYNQSGIWKADSHTTYGRMVETRFHVGGHGFLGYEFDNPCGGSCNWSAEAGVLYHGRTHLNDKIGRASCRERV